MQDISKRGLLFLDDGSSAQSLSATYAKAYERNPEFYAFYRSLQAYRNSIGKEGDVLVVSPDSEFFKYFKNAAPGGR